LIFSILFRGVHFVCMALLYLLYWISYPFLALVWRRQLIDPSDDPSRKDAVIAVNR
jgi:hypothetical protein